LAAVARHTFTVSAVGGGPFESHVGTLAVCNLLVAGVAVRLRHEATERLDLAEAEWRQRQALTDG
jgi:DNA-binding MurR/RpiR family transcriptional regulator